MENKTLFPSEPNREIIVINHFQLFSGPDGEVTLVFGQIYPDIVVAQEAGEADASVPVGRVIGRFQLTYSGANELLKSLASVLNKSRQGGLKIVN